MKYINPYYPWFDSVGTVYASGSKDGCFSTKSAGWGIVALNEDSGTHMKMSFDMIKNNSYANGCFAGFNYKNAGGKATPSVFIYVNANNNFAIYVNNAVVAQTTGVIMEIGKWYHLFLEVDTAKGIVSLYVDGKKICEYTEYVKTGAAVYDFRIYTNANQLKFKNLIVTDGELSLNETVMEVETAVESSEWEKGQDGYATENVGKNIVLKPSKTKIDGYIITAASVVWESAIGSDNVPAITASMGAQSKKIQLPSINSHVVGTCFDKVDSLENIVITSAE